MNKVTENRAAKNKELVGKKFGSITVIELIEEKDKYGYFQCKCKCDCGNEIITTLSRVKLGRVISCGCSRKGIREYEDLTGFKFGNLTAMKRSELELGRTYWICKCDCGNESKVRADSLKDGSVISCGCSSSKNLKKGADAGRYEGTKIHLISERKISSNNTSGITGVSWDRRRRKWTANIGFKGKNIFLGAYEHKESAIKARKEAEEKYFKPMIEEYENGGQINE